MMSEANHVWIRVVSRVQTAKEVTVETVSAQDWTRIRQYSDWLEEGGFLRQVSLVYADQEISVRLPDDSVARVRILNIDKETNGTSIWPHDDDYTNETMCRRILADTELVLLPAAAAEDNTDTTFRLQAALEEYSLSMQQLYTRLDESPTRVCCSGGTAVLHPDDWPGESPYGSISIVGESAEGCLKGYMVRVEVSEYVKKNYIGKSFYKTKVNYKVSIPR